MGKTILVIGTYDTKDDELQYICGCIRDQGGNVLSMDVSVLGDPTAPTGISKHNVAEAAGSSIREAIDFGRREHRHADHGEGRFASRRAAPRRRQDRRHARAGRHHGGPILHSIAQGALPLGVPKFVVSTVSFSPLIPADRLSPDIQMILWAGGPLRIELGLQIVPLAGGRRGCGGRQRGRNRRRGIGLSSA